MGTITITKASLPPMFSLRHSTFLVRYWIFLFFIRCSTLMFSTPDIRPTFEIRFPFFIRCWTFDVRCWTFIFSLMFDVPPPIHSLPCVPCIPWLIHYIDHRSCPNKGQPRGDCPYKSLLTNRNLSPSTSEFSCSFFDTLFPWRPWRYWRDD